MVVYNNPGGNSGFQLIILILVYSGPCESFKSPHLNMLSDPEDLKPLTHLKAVTRELNVI